jgi:hypothetical protein
MRPQNSGLGWFRAKNALQPSPGAYALSEKIELCFTLEAADWSS